ncbi:hypothetical protein ACJX0J_035010, partial [Zea mays]
MTCSNSCREQGQPTFLKKQSNLEYNLKRSSTVASFQSSRTITIVTKPNLLTQSLVTGIARQNIIHSLQTWQIKTLDNIWELPNAFCNANNISEKKSRFLKTKLAKHFFLIRLVRSLTRVTELFFYLVSHDRVNGDAKVVVPKHLVIFFPLVTVKHAVVIYLFGL